MRTERRPGNRLGRGLSRAGVSGALTARSLAPVSVLSADALEPRPRRQRLRLPDTNGTRPIGPVARRLLDVKAMLEAGELSPFCLFELRDALEDLAQSVWGESTEPTTVTPDEEAPFSVCIVGGLWLEVLLHGPSFGGAAVGKRSFECTRFKDPARAVVELGPNVPDLCIVDMDIPGASELVLALANDPRLDLVPVITVTLANGGVQPPCGVARTFTHPIDAMAFREACTEVVVQRREPTIRMEFPPQFAALAPAAPVRALPPAPSPEVARPAAPSVRPPEKRESGFSAPAPTRPKPVRQAARAQPLEGRHVIVANDDPAVCWFLADQLRRLGATVREALGSASALDQALDMGLSTTLDAIFCEAEMRGMDGVMLTRVLRSEARTRHVPVIILAATKQALRVARNAGVADACLSMGTDPEVLAATVAGFIQVRAVTEPEIVVDLEPLAAEALPTAAPQEEPPRAARMLTPPPPLDLVLAPVAPAPSVLLELPSLPPEPSRPLLPARDALAATPAFPEIPQPGVRREERPALDTPATTPPPAPAPAPRRTDVWIAAGLLVCAVLLGAALRWRTAPAHAPVARRVASSPVAASGEGLLDVSLGESFTLTVDGLTRGRGPKLNVTLPAGVHELSTDAPGDKPRSVEILGGRITRVDLAHIAQAIPSH